MQLNKHVGLMAEYNLSMNQKIYAAAEKLSPGQLYENSDAFFGSVFCTLNHIAVGDTIWLKRLSTTMHSHAALAPICELPVPESLDSVLFESLSELKVRRDLLDNAFINLGNSISDVELASSVNYKNLKGESFSKNLFSLLMHVFNHQTHHRGQVTTLLSQFGFDYGATDLVLLIPNT
tara:strand:- start:431 stop:964 length:534 start_codon:yes stop_codon:yes gene_type:complete